MIYDSFLSARPLEESSHMVSICSIGTGTGGDLLGLILAIKKHLPSCGSINIVSVEGNEIAHRLMQEIISRTQNRIKMQIYCTPITYEFRTDLFNPIHNFLAQEQKSFDFVISSKMMNELIQKGMSNAPYYAYLDTFSKFLNDCGTLLILDITTSVDSTEQWYPNLLNGQVNKFVSDRPEYKTILPLACYEFEDACHCDCYSQNTIRVSHRHSTNEPSKICYRLIGKRSLAQRISSSVALWSCPITKNNKEHCSAFANR